MDISIITLFPESLTPILDSSILKRAKNKGLVSYYLYNLREFGEGPHQIVDGKPYGGGAGMVFRADILAKALKKVVSEIGQGTVLLMTPSGEKFSQHKAQQLSKIKHLIIICGHYEGIDQRFIDKYVDLELSIGDYVLTGGELPALVIIDSVIRLIPGVLNKEESFQEESFTNNLLEYPHYTRPDEFEGLKVPEVLLSGNHGEVKKWRQEESLEKTKKIRPDLLSLLERV